MYFASLLLSIFLPEKPTIFPNLSWIGKIILFENLSEKVDELAKIPAFVNVDISYPFLRRYSIAFLSSIGA